ncbi:MAG: C_GCAxxG_C_C family protein [Desulfuromonadales bacterium]|nr:C_GCAxxG_C_C family protein [Desulfuromonadales bacterium]
MLKFFARNRAFDREITPLETAAELAGELFDRGYSCTKAVLQATTGSTNSELLAAASGFSCGIGKSGCLCGAVTGGVMALGLKGRDKQSGKLVATFKEAFQTTCCRGLSKDYRWMSKEHLANCRKITVATAGMVEKFQSNKR